MIKKMLAAVLAIMMIVGLTACGEKAEESKPAANGSATTESAKPEETKKVKVQIGYENNPGEPIDLGCQEWKRLVEEKSNGTIEVELCPSSQLGSKNDILDQMLMGEAVITIGDGAFWADYGAPEMGITSAPYVYDNWEQTWKLMDSDWYAEQCEKLASNGIRLLTSKWKYGERQLMTDSPVRTIEDMKGLIIRVPNTTIQMRAFTAMGCSPTAMALGDVYTNTQQHNINGMENPMATLFGQSYFDVAKYITLTTHVRMPIQWACSEQWFQSLTEEQQKILMECGDQAAEFQNQKQDEMLADYVAKMEENGVEIIELNDAELQKFVDAATSVYSDPEVTGEWRDGLYDYVREIMAG